MNVAKQYRGVVVFVYSFKYTYCLVLVLPIWRIAESDGVMLVASTHVRAVRQVRRQGFQVDGPAFAEGARAIRKRGGRVRNGCHLFPIQAASAREHVLDAHAV